jgi:hypothetical protein
MRRQETLTLEQTNESHFIFASLMATHVMVIVSVRYRADLTMPMLTA